MLSDAEVSQSVSWQLRWDQRCNAAVITTAVEDGTVTLSGFAGSEQERAAARRAARRAVGVVDLADESVVAPVDSIAARSRTQARP